MTERPVTERPGGTLQVFAPDGVPEIEPGVDLAGLVASLLGAGDPAPVDGDVVVVTSKVVSKAEGRIVAAGSHDRELEAETVRVVASRGFTKIVRTRLGLVMAAAGIDRSNVPRGSIVLLPLDPDASARALRSRLHAELGVNVGVIVTDTAGRAWREGQTDMAIGVSGLLPLESFVGRVDAHGHELAVTAPAVADEIAGAAELAQGKLGGRPVALVRGRADLVLPVGEDGPGAAALQRPGEADMFGLGMREAVVTALAAEPGDLALFGAPAAADELEAALRRVVPDSTWRPGGEGRLWQVGLPATAPREVVAALCFAHGWTLHRWQADGRGLVATLSPTVP